MWLRGGKMVISNIMVSRFDINLYISMPLDNQSIHTQTQYSAPIRSMWFNVTCEICWIILEHQNSEQGLGAGLIMIKMLLEEEHFKEKTGTTTNQVWLN